MFTTWATDTATIANNNIVTIIFYLSFNLLS